MTIHGSISNFILKWHSKQMINYIGKPNSFVTIISHAFFPGNRGTVKTLYMIPFIAYTNFISHVLC